MRGGYDGFDAAVHRSDVVRAAVAEGADALGEGFRRYAFDRRFRRGVDVHEIYGIGLMEGAREIVHQGRGAGVAMRLEEHVNVAETAGAGGGERRSDFSGMVAVIVDHGDARDGAAHLKAAVDSGESGEGFANGVRRDFEFQAHGGGRGRIEDVMRAGNVQAETAQILAAQSEMKFARHVAGGGMRDLN